MAKLEERPVDAGLAGLKGRDDAAAVEWWTERFALLAGIPSDVARAGAIVPQFRELSHLPEAERRRLTRARVQAFVALPADQRQRVLAGRKLATAIDPTLVASDDAVSAQVAGEVPGADAIQREMRS